MQSWIAAAYALALVGCSGHEVRSTSPPAASPSTPGGSNTTTQEDTMDSGARSPAGDSHPGQIVHDDKVEGRTWTRSAAEVPATIAWVEVDGSWRPVVRIEITGTPAQRRITKFGADGKMLETTIQAPPSPPVRMSAPTPTPDKR